MVAHCHGCARSVFFSLDLAGVPGMGPAALAGALDRLPPALALVGDPNRLLGRRLRLGPHRGIPT